MNGKGGSEGRKSAASTIQHNPVKLQWACIGIDWEGNGKGFASKLERKGDLEKGSGTVELGHGRGNLKEEWKMRKKDRNGQLKGGRSGDSFPR